MTNDSNSEASRGQASSVYAWRPVAMLMLVLAGLVLVLQSDLLRETLRSIADSPLR
jgi:hypothetical protein